MRGITITDRDQRGILSVSLSDLLMVLQPVINDSLWTCDDVESTGEGSADLHRVCDSKSKIDSQTLSTLASGLDQVIDGTFSAFRPNQSQPWLIVRAVDSSAFDVETDELRLLQSLRTRFRLVSDIPQ